MGARSVVWDRTFGAIAGISFSNPTIRFAPAWVFAMSGASTPISLSLIKAVQGRITCGDLISPPVSASRFCDC